MKASDYLFVFADDCNKYYRVPLYSYCKIINKKSATGWVADFLLVIKKFYRLFLLVGKNKPDLDLEEVVSGEPKCDMAQRNPMVLLLSFSSR